MDLRVPLRLRVNQKFEDAEDLKVIAKSSLRNLLIKEDIVSPEALCKTKLGSIVSRYADGGSVSDDIDNIGEFISNMEFDPTFYRQPKNPYNPLVKDDDTHIEFDLFVTKSGQCIGRCTSRGTTGFLKVKGNENGRHEALSFGIKETGEVLGNIRSECHL